MAVDEMRGVSGYHDLMSIGHFPEVQFKVLLLRTPFAFVLLLCIGSLPN